MTKLQDMTTQQLELRLLVDVKIKESALLSNVEGAALIGTQHTICQHSASEHDRSVYRQIASNYFASLRKA